MRLSSIALQLYTVRDETARDFVSTVRQVAEMGYPAVEFAGYGGLSADDLRALLEETGLKAASTHIGLDALQHDLDGVVAYSRTLGLRFVNVPWLAEEWRSADALPRLASALNELGGRLAAHGVRLAYHNHDFEFREQIDGQPLLDRLLDATDPDRVALELDTYWAAYAGVDPAAYIRRRGARVAMIHLKDMTPDRHFTEVGDGTLDTPGILAAADAVGTEWYIVENDAPQLASLESARRSFAYLSSRAEQA